MILAHHRAKYRPQRVPPDSDLQISQQFDLDRHLPHFQVQPLTVKQILVLVFRVNLQHIDICQIRVVDRQCPAQTFIVTLNHTGHPGESCPNHIPPFFAVQMDLIPGDRPLPGLVGVNRKESRAVIAAVRANGKNIGAVLIIGKLIPGLRYRRNLALSLVSKQLTYRSIQTEIHRSLKDR